MKKQMLVKILQQWKVIIMQHLVTEGAIIIETLNQLNGKVERLEVKFQCSKQLGSVEAEWDWGTSFLRLNEKKMI